jgi:tetratricopeptide (TPR) repeat protein
MRKDLFYGRRIWIALVVLASVCWELAGTTANAQLTKQKLIGDAVSEIGTGYAEIDEAIKRFLNGDVIGARQFLESAKRNDPKLPPTDVTLAKMYLEANSLPAARVSLEKSAMENPSDPEAHLILAEIARREGRLIEADALYEKGLALSEKFTENTRRKRNMEIRARMGRAVVAQQRKQWAAAEADLEALLKLDPENAIGHYQLGIAQFMQGKHRDGFTHFQEAKRLDKNKQIPNEFVAAASMYDQLDRPADAQRAFDQVKTSTADANTMTAYAQWLIKTGSVQKAEQILDQARKANPDSLSLLILSGVAARMNNRMKPAEDFFVQAWGISPANLDVLNQLALLLIEQQDQAKRERALQFAGISSQLSSQNGDAQMTLAWVLYQLGRMNEANTALQNAVRLGNLTPDSRYLIARILIDTKREDQAKQILQEALDGDYQGIFINRQAAQALLDTINKS